MGQIAERDADCTIVTSDNPRTEDPDAIIDDIEAGMRGSQHERVTDRLSAIRRAMNLAGDDDIVLLAGDTHDAHAWHEALERQYRPNVRVFDLASVDWPPPSLVKGKKPERGAVAWICKGTACLPPITSLADTQRLLSAGR